MLGTLHKTENGWVVKYFSPPSANHFGWINSDGKFEEIPLHHDCVSESLQNISKIEFEIVEVGLNKSAKLNNNT